MIFSVPLCPCLPAGRSVVIQLFYERTITFDKKREAVFKQPPFLRRFKRFGYFLNLFLAKPIPISPEPKRRSVAGSGMGAELNVTSCIIMYEPENWRYAMSAVPLEMPRNAPSLYPPGVEMRAAVKRS